MNTLLTEEPVHIIYLPGFGDDYDRLRGKFLGRWRFDNVTVELVPMNWASDETFEQKITRIDRAIDQAQGKKIVLIGESASGAVVVHMYARRQHDISRAMTLCGKNTHPENVMSRYYEKYPVYRQVMCTLDEAINQLDQAARRRFISVHPIYDPVVSVEDTRLPDCREVRLPAVGHLFVIFLALTLWSPRLVKIALATE